jgi:hypothetical protein
MFLHMNLAVFRLSMRFDSAPLHSARDTRYLPRHLRFPASSSPRNSPTGNGSGPETSANRTSSTDRSSRRSRRSRPSSLSLNKSGSAQAVRFEVE